MTILSINVGLPREVEWKGKIVRTGIHKGPVPCPVRVSQLNLAGDRQADLSVHGGIEKAVYVYPSEHYPFWQQGYPDMDLPWGMFGENFTAEGLTEDSVCIGDRFQVGSAEFVVTQPRMPCFKLGIRFGRPDIMKRFLRSGRTGFYLAVLREGEVAAGDKIDLLARDEYGVTVTEIVSLYANDLATEDRLRRASELPALPADWRDYFRKRLQGKFSR